MLLNYCGIGMEQQDILELIDEMLMNYSLIKLMIIKDRKNKEDGIMKGVANDAEGGGCGGISDPTYNQAVNFMKPVEVLLLPKGKQVTNPELWLKVICAIEKEYEGNLRAMRIFYSRFINHKTVRDIIAEEKVNQKEYEKIIYNFKWTILLIGIKEKLFIQ